MAKHNFSFNVCYLCLVSKRILLNISAHISIRKNDITLLIGGMHDIATVVLGAALLNAKQPTKGSMCVCVCVDIRLVSGLRTHLSHVCDLCVHSLDISVEHARNFNLSLKCHY